MGDNTVSRIYDALKVADIEFSALSTGGFNIFGDRKSVDHFRTALHYYDQWDSTVTNLRHWREEAGKLHAKLAEISLLASSWEGGSTGARMTQIANIAKDSRS